MHGIPVDLQRFYIPVELDRSRVVAFDNRATFLVYQKYGPGFFRELYEADPKAADPKHPSLTIRSLDALEFFLWAGLQRDAEAAGETLTLEDVKEFIVPTSIDDIAKALLVALSATRRRPAKDDSKNV